MIPGNNTFYLDGIRYEDSSGSRVSENSGDSLFGLLIAQVSSWERPCLFSGSATSAAHDEAMNSTNCRAATDVRDEVVRSSFLWLTPDSWRTEDRQPY